MRDESAMSGFPLAREQPRVTGLNVGLMLTLILSVPKSRLPLSTLLPRPFPLNNKSCVNQGASAKEWDPANPGYAAWRQYRDSNAWAVATLTRLKAWGFTTIAGWSDFQTIKACRDADVAFAPELHIGATASAPWWDM
jgi:hypothetical protein